MRADNGTYRPTFCSATTIDDVLVESRSADRPYYTRRVHSPTPTARGKVTQASAKPIPGNDEFDRLGVQTMSGNASTDRSVYFSFQLMVVFSFKTYKIIQSTQICYHFFLRDQSNFK